MEKSGEFTINEDLEENNDIVKLWEPLKFEIDENYNYVPNKLTFCLFSNILYNFIAFPILTVILKVIYDLKIEGKENIKKLNTGAVSVSNHVLFLDCAVIGKAFGLKKIYYTTREGSFKIPIVRRLIKLLRAIPIPSGIKNKERFLKEIDGLLQNNKFVHFYPEASMWPYHKKLRNFKIGAFTCAVRNNVPIIPMVISFRTPVGIRKILKRKPDVTLKILDSVIIEEDLETKEKENKLKELVYKKMKDSLKQ